MNIRKGPILTFLLTVSLSFFPTSQYNKYNFLKGSLVGMVYDETGCTVSKAGVAVRGVNYEETLKTDGQGRFNIRKMPTGVYQLSLVSSNPEMDVKKEIAIHLGKETYVSLVIRTQSVSGQARLLGPVYFRDYEGKVFRQETILGDRMYSVDYTYDSKGRVRALRDSFDQEWKYEYTPSGKIRKVTRPDKKAIYYNYDKDNELTKIDLPWGYKILYEKKDNRFIKSITKYKNLILYQFVYSIDPNGNKVKVEEGGNQKSSFEYSYDGNDKLQAIQDTKTGKINSNVVEFKGKIKNGAIDGALENKNGKYQDRNYEYYFDVRGNIIRQKAKRGDAEIQRQFNRRDLLIQETFFYKSAPALSVEYVYDNMDRLVMKTINNRIRYYYYRDQDGHILRKGIANILTGKEKSGTVYTPFHSDIDQDGFELIKYEKTEKLLVRDAEGNARYRVILADVMKHKITTLERQVDMDGDFWGGAESLLGLAAAKMKRPLEEVGKYCVDFYDLPLNETDPLGEEDAISFQTRKTTAKTKSNKLVWPGMSIGCYGFPVPAPPAVKAESSQVLDECDYNWFNYCVDCYEGYDGWDLGGWNCSAWISGLDQLAPNMEGIFSLDTDCYSPSGTWWSAPNAYLYNYGSWCTAFWDENSAGQYEEVGVSFYTSNEYYFTDTRGIQFGYSGEVEREAYTTVYIEYTQPPPPQYSIRIDRYSTTGYNNSFTSWDSITVYGKAFRGAEDISSQIEWYTNGQGDSGYANPPSSEGSEFTFSLNPDPAPPDGRASPLSYYVVASISEGGYMEASITITQDQVDFLIIRRAEFHGLARG